MSGRWTTLGSALRRRGRRPVRLGDGYDSWLVHYYGEKLDELDGECASLGPKGLPAFRDLDDDLWTVLLTTDYSVYPNIKEVLPKMPDPVLQLQYSGGTGVDVLNLSKAFYSKARERFARFSDSPLAEGRILDFGCGWGRLTRFFARDVAPGSLYGCDPVEEILDVCRSTGIPATLAQSEFLPQRLPFDDRFDLVVAFSVFTHLSERAHELCLDAIHATMNPGGILIVTIRPPGYLAQTEMVRPLLRSLGTDPVGALEEPRYLFAPHPPSPDHPQYGGGEMTFGETVISLPYIRERWAPRFELLDTSLLSGDMHQVMLTLRRGET